jgi:hypothetical protein
MCPPSSSHLATDATGWVTHRRQTLNTVDGRDDIGAGKPSEQVSADGSERIGPPGNRVEHWRNNCRLQGLKINRVATRGDDVFDRHSPIQSIMPHGLTSAILRCCLSMDTEQSA